MITPVDCVLNPLPLPEIGVLFVSRDRDQLTKTEHKAVIVVIISLTDGRAAASRCRQGFVARRRGGGRREEDVVLNSALVTDKTLLFPTSQHDHGDKPRSDWLYGDRAGFFSRGISTAAFDPSITHFTLLPRNISV